MRILLISAEYPPDVGGVGDYTRRLGLALLERGHAVAVLTGRYGLVYPSAEGEAPAGASPAATNPKPETRSGGKPRRYTLETWSLQPIIDALDDFAPDIVHLQYQTGAYGMHPAVMLLPSRWRRVEKHLPLVVTAHDLRLPYLFPKADALRNLLTGRLLGDADAVIVTNDDDARRLNALAPASRELYSPRRPLSVPRYVIPIGSNVEPALEPGYDRSVLRASVGARPGHQVIAYFGLLSRTKGVLELLEAIAQLPPRFRLLIVGGAAPLPDDRRVAEDVRQAVQRLDLLERFTITGSLPEDEVSAYLLAADIAALPFADGASYRRGSLLAVLAHGLPTVTTAPAAPLDPPLADGRHALLLPRAEPGALAEALVRLADDAALRERLSEGARELAASFGWPAIAERHESVYHALLSARR